MKLFVGELGPELFRQGLDSHARRDRLAGEGGATMLQILGWLGCLMLAVKLVELCYSPTLRNEEGRLGDYALMLLVIGWIGTFGFAFWIYGQGQAASDVYDEAIYSSETSEKTEEIECLVAQSRGERLGEFC